MSVALVTFEEAVGHLRLDLATGDPREPDLEMKIEQASEIVLDYLKRNETGWDELSVPAVVKAAVLLVLSALWDDREGGGEGDYLADNGPVARLLRRYRDPAIA